MHTISFYRITITREMRLIGIAHEAHPRIGDSGP